MITVISNPQQRFKDSFAYSPEIGLAVRANGEEQPKVLDANGNIWPAHISAPTVAPTVVLDGTGIIQGHSQWTAYKYVYISSQSFPLIEADFAYDGVLGPRSNPSPQSTSIQIPDNSKQAVTVTGTADPLIDRILIFRTNFQASTQDAQLAATANAVFYVGYLANPGATTAVFEDNFLTITGSLQIEWHHFAAPQFQFVAYYDPYFYGFGNYSYTGLVTVDSSGVLTVTDGQKWFDGRNNQFVKLDGIVAGGIDGRGTFRFQYTTSTTARLVLANGSFATVASPPVDAIRIIIQGPASTLFRSQRRNPFSWGEVQILDDGTPLTQLFALKVGGGYGSALAIVPDQALLKLDMEFPTRAYSYNLQAAGTDNFSQTRRLISDTHSISSHWSQFPLVNNQGRTVLRGMDFKNYAIVECDGIQQVPISSKIPIILRFLTNIRSRQLLTHGVYDPYSQLACLWVATQDSQTSCNYLIFEHIPSGQWGLSNDFDILSSALVEDPTDSRKKVMVGTETGLFGQAFVPGLFSNFIPSQGLISGLIQSGTTTTLTRAEGQQDFNTTDIGIVGNWCIITDERGEQEQFARIANVTSDTLTFDLMRSYNNGYITRLDPIPRTGYQFYIGIIECSLIKFFDLNQPTEDKRIEEVWATAVRSISEDLRQFQVRFYRDRESLHYATFPLQNLPLPPTDGQSSVWMAKTNIPPWLLKSMGLEFLERSYTDFQMINATIKMKQVPA